MLVQKRTCYEKPRSSRVVLNDIHSRLNPVVVNRVVQTPSLASLQAAVALANQTKRAISVAGGGYAMGGQQFGSDVIHVDTKLLNRILNFDSESGLVEVQSGIQWSELIPAYLALQIGKERQWSIAQKQTGADRLSLGGALSVNIHGRGLQFRPFVSDIESFTLIDAHGAVITCSRTVNPDLFSLAIGGYGLFGLVYSVTLQLQPRQKFRRDVVLLDSQHLLATMEQRITEGYVYGDFQFAIDPQSADFLRKGILSTYQPVDPTTPISQEPQELPPLEWLHLLYLAHVDKARAFELLVRHARACHRQVQWSETHQLGYYRDGYHQMLNQKLDSQSSGSEMITELFVPRPQLEHFLEKVREDFRQHHVDVIYGTIRLIEREEETFLRWARDRWACIVFNLHVVHTPKGIKRAAETFRRLIDLAIHYQGSFYLPYHKWASREQVEACYPEFPEFLRLKRMYDPDERFQSDWYRQYRRMFSDVL